MSYEVDNRVVRMQFDNEDFERRVKQSRQSLDDLKKATSLRPHLTESRTFKMKLINSIYQTFLMVSER